MKYSYTKLFAICSLLLVLGACKKDSEPLPAIDFRGYTGFTDNSVVTNPVDATDWTQDATWTTTEQNLFSKYNLAFGKQQVAADAWYCRAYPNPATRAAGNKFIGSVNTNNATANTAPVRLAYSIVDANYQEMTWGDLDNFGQQFGALFSFKDAKYADNTLYRVYYVIYNHLTKEVLYQGHGDIKVVP